MSTNLNKAALWRRHWDFQVSSPKGRGWPKSAKNRQKIDSGVAPKPSAKFHPRVLGMGTCSVFPTAPSAFHRGGSKPEVVVGGGFRYARGVFSMCSDCLRSAQSVSTLGHTKDRTFGPLPPRLKTSGLA